MLNVEYTTQFKLDLKTAKLRGKNLDLLRKIMKKIEEEVTLEKKLRDHLLTGNWNSHRELHVEPEWLLIYRFVLGYNTVIFVRTGTLADLF